jgi:thiamine-phosphate pyrophosphorylase
MRGLYAIVDLGALESRRLDPILFAEAVLAARPAALQLRAKLAPSRSALLLLRALAPMCRAARVPLVANDCPDWALEGGCDMVHVGQSDMPIDQVRRLAPRIGVGVSTHTLEQLDAAIAARPTYVAYGPVFETSTKQNPDPVVGIAGLREAHRRAALAGVPLVAIGGITQERAAEIVGIADALAVIGELLPELAASGAQPLAVDWKAGVTARARALGSLFAPDPRRAGAG